MKKDKYCLNCHKKIYSISKWCRKCYLKYGIVRGKNFKNCIDCGIKLKDYQSQLRCQKCYYKTLKGVGNPNYKHGKQIKGDYLCKECHNPVKYYNGYCVKCAQSGSRHRSYIDGRSLVKLYCSECNKQITYGNHRKSTLCKSCSHKGNRNAMFGHTPSGWQVGEYKGIKMRSFWEINIAKWLDLSGIKWKYETHIFSINSTHYTPDFYLPEFNGYIEVKGWETQEFKIKFKKWQKIYNKYNLLLSKQNLIMFGFNFK